MHTAVFCAVNVLALVRWGQPDPLGRFDRFSMTAILLLAGIGSMKARVHGALGSDMSREFFGERFDPLTQRLRTVFRLADALTFLDYGHELIGPLARVPVAQYTGLLLAPSVMAWLWWVDSYLIARFPAALTGAMMQDGPFLLVRHPRYLGLLAGRLSIAALLGSVVGWTTFATMAVLFTLRMGREERHLLEAFPGRYSAYVKRTGRVLPRLTA